MGEDIGVWFVHDVMNYVLCSLEDCMLGNCTLK